MLLDLLGKPRGLIRFVKDRPGHDRRYAIDSATARQELGWRPAIDFEAGLRDTVDWYRANPDWVARIQSGEYQEFYRKQYGGRMK